MDRDFKIIETNVEDKRFMLELTQNLRRQDLDEMLASGIYDFLEEVVRTVEYSECCYKAVMDDGRVACAYGVIPAKVGAQIWFLGTDIIATHRKSFVKISAEILRGWLEKYGRLFNFVSAENTDSIKWLKRLGAKFVERVEYNGHIFWRFEIERG